MGKTKMKRKIGRWIVGIILGILVLVSLGSFAYVHDYYHAQKEAMLYINEPQAGITVDSSVKNRIAFIPEEIKAGLIFYPGGKVQYESYAPLMSTLAERGILCILLHMPGNLAVLDQDAAEGIQEDWKQVENWYMAGHSLGGVMASAYLEDHSEDYEGLILLASYCANDLSKCSLPILSIYGSEDQVLSRESYEKAMSSLPEDYDFTEKIIEGGCHAYFGCYGEQEGDGNASIRPEEQWNETADLIADWIRLLMEFEQ